MQSEKANITIFIGLTTGLILLLATILILVIYLYQQRRLIHMQSIKELGFKHEKNLISSQLEIQENMFRHISQEIHDNIGLTLSLVKLRLNTLDINDIAQIKGQIGVTVELLTESIDQLKDISRSLNADVIHSYGLIRALENEINRINDVSGIEIIFKIEGDAIYLDSQKELIIFRIIQEAFSNILKHAEANTAWLTLAYRDSLLLITIKDNGKGFNSYPESDISKPGSAGLKNMRSRSKMIRAKMEINTKVGNGTELQFTIPL